MGQGAGWGSVALAHIAADLRMAVIGLTVDVTAVTRKQKTEL